MKLCATVTRLLVVAGLAALAAGCTKREISVRVLDESRREVCSSTTQFSAQVQKGEATPSRDAAKPVTSKIEHHPTNMSSCTYRLNVPAVAPDESLTIFVSETGYGGTHRSFPRAMVEGFLEGSGSNPPVFTIVSKDGAPR